MRAFLSCVLFGVALGALLGLLLVVAASGQASATDAARPVTDAQGNDAVVNPAHS
jgi:hypothetical protein